MIKRYILIPGYACGKRKYLEKVSWLNSSSQAYAYHGGGLL
jgi:hypothetical protein